MDKELTQKAIAKLQELGIGNFVCPICQGRSFNMPPHIATVLVTDMLGAVKVGDHIPAAVIVCNKCGHMDFFALTVLMPDELKKEQ